MQVEGKSKTAEPQASFAFRSWLNAVTSLGFVLLQSACTFFFAISGVRLLLGIGSFAAAAAVRHPSHGFHANIFRVPMLLIAVVGSVVNLLAIHRVRVLRVRPSSQWRMQPVAPDRLRSENIQVALAILTLVLVLMEEAIHIYEHSF